MKGSVAGSVLPADGTLCQFKLGGSFVSPIYTCMPWWRCTVNPDGSLRSHHFRLTG
jgi:hypothetical protein